MVNSKEMMSKKPKKINDCIYLIRGQQVMLDQDLAEIYGYEVKRFNEQVKRNIERFPNDFMFQLTLEEVDSVRSQIATSRNSTMYLGQQGGRRYRPYAFTELGIYMLPSVLKGSLAAKQNIEIIRTFKEMRHCIAENQLLLNRNDRTELIELKVDKVSSKLGTLEKAQKVDRANIKEVEKKLSAQINEISKNFIDDEKVKEFTILQGKKFESDKAYTSIYKKAKKTIYVIDNYVNIKTLNLLSSKKNGVNVTLFTDNHKGNNGNLSASIVSDFEKEFPHLTLKPNDKCHDRYIVLDFNTILMKLCTFVVLRAKMEGVKYQQ